MLSAADHAAILENPQRIAVTFIARGWVQLLEPLTMTQCGVSVTVPVGFAFDGASVPAPFYALFGQKLSGSTLRAATAHDWMCRSRIYPQPFVSRFFYRQLRADGSGRFRSWCFWAAVRFFGPRWPNPK